MPRSVAVLHVLDYLYYGLRRIMEYELCLRMTAVYTFRQPISTQHLEVTTGMFTCFCAFVCVQCLVCLLFILIAVASDSCRCPGCVKLSVALRAYVEFCALRTLRLNF